MYNVPFPSAFNDELTTRYRGLKRKTAKRVASGDGKVKVGKDPIDFNLYQYIALKHLTLKNKEYIFSHCFLLICWNLMCRAGNGVSICFSHLD